MIVLPLPLKQPFSTNLKLGGKLDQSIRYKLVVLINGFNMEFWYESVSISALMDVAANLFSNPPQTQTVLCAKQPHS